MLHIAIHDMLQPLLQESSIVSTRAISHRDINLLISKINSRNGGDEVLIGINKNSQTDWDRKKAHRCARKERLHNTAFLPCLFNLNHSEISLDDLQVLDICGEVL
jgi:hypothetical protein